MEWETDNCQFADNFANDLDDFDLKLDLNEDLNSYGICYLILNSNFIINFN